MIVDIFIIPKRLYKICIFVCSSDIPSRQNTDVIYRIQPYPTLCIPISCRAILYHTIPYHTIPYHTIPYHTIPYHTIPYHTIPYHTIPYHTYHTMPYHTIPYITMPCHAIPYHAIPYHAIPSHPIPSHTIPYHTIPYHAIRYFPFTTRITSFTRLTRSYNIMIFRITTGLNVGSLTLDLMRGPARVPFKKMDSNVTLYIPADTSSPMEIPWPAAQAARNTTRSKHLYYRIWIPYAQGCGLS